MSYRDDNESLRAQVERLEQELAESRASRPARRASRWAWWDKGVVAVLLASAAVRSVLVAARGTTASDVAWGIVTLVTLVIWALSLNNSESQ